MTEKKDYPFLTEIGDLPKWVVGRTVPDVVQIIARDRSVLSHAYTRTIFRVEKETHILRVCKDLGMMNDVYYGFDQTVSNTTVLWGDTSAMGDGNYDVINDVIKTPKTPPSREEILTELAVAGKFPFNVDMLTHELVHGLQMPANAWKRLIMVLMLFPGVGDRYFPGRELMEVMAYRLTTIEPHEGTPEVLARHLLTSASRDGRLAYDGFKKEKIMSAVEGVDDLLTLGINTRELCLLVSEHGGWDEVTQTYPQINRARVRLLLDRQKKISDLPQLRNEYIVGRVRDAARTKEIAQTELLAVASRIGSTNG